MSEARDRIERAILAYREMAHRRGIASDDMTEDEVIARILPPEDEPGPRTLGGMWADIMVELALISLTPDESVEIAVRDSGDPPAVEVRFRGWYPISELEQGSLVLFRMPQERLMPAEIRLGLMNALAELRGPAPTGH